MRKKQKKDVYEDASIYTTNTSFLNRLTCIATNVILVLIINNLFSSANISIIQLFLTIQYIAIKFQSFFQT